MLDIKFYICEIENIFIIFQNELYLIMSTDQDNLVNGYDVSKAKMPSTSNIASLNLNRTTPYPRPLAARDSKLARRNR